MVRRSRTRTIVIALVALVVLLGVGFATYFLNLNRKPETVATSVRARFDQPKTLGYAPEVVTTLTFTEKRTDAAKQTGIAHSLEAVFATDDRVYIVDHPKWHIGSRVRWFSRTGEFLGQHLAPSGSTLFSASPDGFAYVLAKSGREDERVLLFDREGSLESTFTVPLGANSGGLAFFDGEVYVSAQSGEASLEGQTISVSEVYVPVTSGGRQATDAEAEKGVLEFWRLGDDGKRYRREISTDGFGSQAVTTQYVTRVVDGAKLELPATAIPLAVDKQGRLVVGLNPTGIGGSGRPLAGWPAAKEPYSEIAFVSFDGTTRALNVIDTILPAFPVRYFDLDEDGYWTLTAGADSVKLKHYVAVTR